LEEKVFSCSKGPEPSPNRPQGSQPPTTTFEDTVRRTASVYSADNRDDDAKSERNDQFESNSETDSSESDVTCPQQPSGHDDVWDLACN
jgi:hypothetical protein